MVKANEEKRKRPRPVIRAGLLGLLLLFFVITGCAGSGDLTPLNRSRLYARISRAI